MIVGVVGSSRANNQTVDLAFAVGRALASEGAVVVTGGDHRGKRNRVRTQAVLGALDFGAGARILGLLRSRDTPDYAGPAAVRYVATDKKSGRNILTGCVPDALIALPGGSGTLSEVAFARATKRPVVFLGWDRDAVIGAIGSLEKEIIDLIGLAPELSLPSVPTADLKPWLINRIRRPQCQFAVSVQEATGILGNVTPLHGSDVLRALKETAEATWQRIGDDIAAALHEVGVITQGE